MRKLSVAAIFTICIIFISCKKDTTATTPPVDQPVDPTGTWHLGLDVQGNTNLATRSVYDTIQFPCLKNNLLVIKADNTATSYYVGMDTCFVYKQSNSNYEAIGEQGEPSTFLTWSQAGNVFTLTDTASKYQSTGQLSLVGGHYKLQFYNLIGTMGNYDSTLDVK